MAYPAFSVPGAGHQRGAAIVLALAAQVFTLASPLGAPALAQVPEGPPREEEEEAEPVLRPPELVDFVEAAYPPEAEAEGLEAAVLLELTIGADGAVVDASVVTSAGHGFDEAALEAVRRFRFRPATRDGEPIPSRIRYQYVFELRATEPEPEPETPPPGRIEGRLLGVEDGNPIVGVEVLLTNEDQSIARRVLSTGQGTFLFDDLPPGTYQIRVIGNEYGDLTQQEEVHAGEVTELTYRLRILEPEDPELGEVAFGAVAVVDPPPREVTRRTIRREELTRIPGTRGDALRAVQILPGVARPPLGSGQLIVRGAAPGDSEVFFNGVPVPLLYHFGGLTSFINSRLLNEISLYPGNFSGKYGRRVGAILDVTSRDPATDRFHGAIEFSGIDTWILAEGPVTDNFAIAGGFRRSLIDLVFEYVVPDNTLQTTQAPVYYDYQLFSTWRPTERDRVRFNFYGSDDRLEIFSDEPIGDDPSVRGDFNLSTRFNYTQASWYHQYDGDLDHDVELLFGPVDLTFGLGPSIQFDGHFNQIYARSEWHARINSRMRAIFGTDLFLVPFTLNFVGPPVRQTEGNPQAQSLASEETIYFSAKGTAFRPGFYLETDMRLGDLQLLMALRLDYYHEIRDWSFDPRLNALYSVTEDLTLKAAVGMYSQPPEFFESDPDLGNPNLSPIHSIHVGVGASYDILQGIQVGLDGFYKYLWDRVVGTIGGIPPVFTNQGVGRIYGMEVSGRIEPSGRPYFGFLSYTLSRSERRDGPHEPWRLFDYDQTHIFTASYVYRFPRRWELGGTLRLISGNPYTPIVGSIYDAFVDVYNPVYGSTNSARSDFYQRLDIRVSKEWVFDRGGRMTFFIDILNVYNAKNEEGVIYDRFYRNNTPIYGLPILPTFGLRGEI